MSRLDNLRARLLKGSFGRLVREAVHQHPHVFGGPADRVSLGKDVVLQGALLNVNSGRIRIGDSTFFGTGVALLTGTHDASLTGIERQRAIPREGRDIVIGEGVWIGSNATVTGPCTIGRDAIIFPGAMVTKDVAPGARVAGIPAKPIG